MAYTPSQRWLVSGKAFFLRLKIMNRIDKILSSLYINIYINNAPTKQTKNFTQIL